MKIEPRLVQVCLGTAHRQGQSTRPIPPPGLVGKRLIMTELDGAQRLCAVKLEGTSDEEALGPFDADCFEVFADYGARA